MIGYELTQTEKDNIQCKPYSSSQEFSCALDINDKWYIVLSNQDKKIIENTQYDWILSLPQSEFIQKPINI
jgi:hypothetical protein